MDKTEQLRLRLMSEGLDVDDLKHDPFEQFESWYQQTIGTGIYEPGAMLLATVDESGKPWQRTVLLKLFDEKGFVFFTNYESRKAKQLSGNNNVSIAFPWHSLGRQVHINGTAEKISTAETLNYFMTRPRGSQIGAWASDQSSMISSRAILEKAVESIKEKFHNNEVPLPPFWGGYRITPQSFEFWQARESRLHDRFIYESESDAQWRVSRLSP